MTNDPIRRNIIRKFRDGAKRYPEFGALFFAVGAVALLQPLLELSAEVMRDGQTADVPLLVTCAVLFLFAGVNLIYYAVLAVDVRMKNKRDA